MATGKSGYFDLSTTKTNVKVRVNWSETYDVSANTSTLQITSIQVMAVSPYGYYGYTYYPNGTAKINGATVATFKSATPSHRVRIEAQDTWYAISGAPYTSEPISHNTDGSKSVVIAIDITGYSSDGSGDSGWKASGSKTVKLTTIPRASTIGATDANVGASSTITVNRKSTSYTHTIAYKFGSLSGYINADGEAVTAETKITATNIAFTVPTSWYNQIPGAKSAVCTLTIKTYSGSTQIGDAQTTTFTVTASLAASAPTVSGTVKDTNSTTIALTGSSDRLVRYYSIAKCTITATAKNGASITEKYINDVAVEDTLTVDAVETDAFVFVAKDSRGYISQITVKKTLIPYVKLTANVACTRDDPTSGKATLTIKGNYFNSSFGSKSNTLTIKYKIGSGDTVTAAAADITYTDTGYTAQISLSGLDYQSQHRVSVTIADELMSLSKTATLKKGIPLADWGENDWNFNVAVTFAKNYPVEYNRLCSDCDAAITPGLYYLSGVNCINHPGKIPSGGYGVMLVEKRNGDIYQTVKYRGYIAVRYSIRDENDINNASSWTPWEYVNPPMEAGVEYRTTERYQGNTVFTKLVDFGPLPNTTTKTVSCGVAGGNIISWSAVVFTGSGSAFSFPFIAANGSVYAVAYISSAGLITVAALKDTSDATAKFTLKYIKS